MSEAKEPHWKLNVAAIAGIIVFALMGASAVWGKADKAEVLDLDKRLHAAEKAQSVQLEAQKWILEDLKKANDKLDRILNALYFPRESGSFQPPPPSTPSPLNK